MNKGEDVLPELVRSAMLLLFLGCPIVTTAGQDSLEIPYTVMPAVPGEACMVCGATLTDEDIALMVRGRRVPLRRAMLDQFLANPEEYIARLQPRGALFQEGGHQGAGGSVETGVDFFWFAVGLYLLIALLFAGLSGYTAVSKNLDPIPHFFIGLLFSLPGYLYVLTRTPAKGNGPVPPGLSKVATTRQPVRCERCGALNHPSSERCSACGATMIPLVPSEVQKRW